VTGYGAEDSAKDRKAEAEARRLRRLRRLFPFLMVVVFLVYAFTTNLIPSSSMEPTLVPGDQILTLRSWLAYFGGRVPARNDVVIFNLPPQQAKILGADPSDANEPEGRRPIGVFRGPPGETLIKRVIGLPGETVSLKNGKILINGQPIETPYKTVPGDPDFEVDYPFAGSHPVKLGPDEVFLMGDNRPVSEDSRFFGPVKLKNIRGKYVMVLFHRDVHDPLDEQVKKGQQAQDTLHSILPHLRHRKDVGR
jgi:signal peptidase I